MLHHDKVVAIADVVAAGAIVSRLPGKSEARPRLTAEVLEAALAARESPEWGHPTVRTVVLGCPLTEDGVRRGLEDVYRTLAQHAAAGRERIELVDRANRVRPRTLV